MSWFYIALLATLIYSIVNLIDDNMLQFIYEGPLIATAISGIFGIIPVVSLLFLHTTNISTGLAVLAVLSGFLTTVYFFFYFKGLQLEQPSVVIALFSLVPATLPFLAHFFLHEQLSTKEIIGFIIVLVASFCLTALDIKKFKFSKALLPVIIAVILVDIISLITKHVYQKSHFYPAFMYFSLGVGLGGLCFFFLIHVQKTARKLRKLKVPFIKFLPILIIGQGLAVAADFILNLAVSKGPVSLIKVIEGIQPMFVLLIALILFPLAPKFFREALPGKSKVRKFGFMILIVIGLSLISTS